MDQDNISSGDAAPTGLESQFRLADVINGLADDLKALRDGTLTPNEALVRAALAKQFFNGVRLVVTANKFLLGNARQLPPAPSTAEPEQPRPDVEIIPPGRARKAPAKKAAPRRKRAK